MRVSCCVSGEVWGFELVDVGYAYKGELLVNSLSVLMLCQVLQEHMRGSRDSYIELRIGPLPPSLAGQGKQRCSHRIAWFGSRKRLVPIYLSTPHPNQA